MAAPWTPLKRVPARTSGRVSRRLPCPACIPVARAHLKIAQKIIGVTKRERAVADGQDPRQEDPQNPVHFVPLTRSNTHSRTHARMHRRRPSHTFACTQRERHTHTRRQWQTNERKNTIQSQAQKTSAPRLHSGPSKRKTPRKASMHTLKPQYTPTASDGSKGAGSGSAAPTAQSSTCRGDDSPLSGPPPAGRPSPHCHAYLQVGQTSAAATHLSRAAIPENRRTRPRSECRCTSRLSPAASASAAAGKRSCNNTVSSSSHPESYEN